MPNVKVQPVEERRHDVVITVLPSDGKFDTYFSNPPGNWHIPASGVPAIRDHETEQLALQAGRDFVDAHQPICHESHFGEFYTLYVRLWYGTEKWGFCIKSPGSAENSRAEYTSYLAALEAGRVQVKKRWADLQESLSKK